MNRWLLHDLSGVLPDYTFEVNPNAMESPLQPKSLTVHGRTVDGHMRASGRIPPHDWTFSGIVESQEQYEALQNWVLHAGLTHLTDHLGRKFLVRISQFDPVRAGRTNRPWRHTYTTHVTTYRGPL